MLIFWGFFIPIQQLLVEAGLLRVYYRSNFLKVDYLYFSKNHPDNFKFRAKTASCQVHDKIPKLSEQLFINIHNPLFRNYACIGWLFGETGVEEICLYPRKFNTFLVNFL